MRRLTMLILGSVVALSGCGSTGEQAFNTRSTDAPVANGSVSTERHEANMRLVLGDAAPLAGRSGNALEITALDVNDTKILTPAVPVPAGSRVVAVQFMASNSGGLPYNDSPATGATVVDAHGTSYPAVTRPAKMQVGQGFRAPLGLAPQAQQIAYVPFIVPQGAKIKKVRFGMDRGTGETAQWRVP